MSSIFRSRMSFSSMSKISSLLVKEIHSRCIYGTDVRTLLLSQAISGNLNSNRNSSLRGIKIYTKSGDRGDSGTATGKRYRKDHKIFVALGTIDELSAHIGLSRELGIKRKHSYTDQLERVQCLLQDAACIVASARPAPPVKDEHVSDKSNTITEVHVKELEEWIDTYSKELPPIKNFILPGGGHASAELHVARAVCRRAERTIVTLAPDYRLPRNVFMYFNRLSDYLFTIARYASVLDGCKEIIYISPAFSDRKSTPS